MESALWAMDLLALIFLCQWALKQDKRGQSDDTD